MADPQIGTLYYPNGRPGYPKPFFNGTVVTDPTQPVTVYPNNQPPGYYTPTTNPTPYNERAAWAFPGCGHAIMEWEVVIDAYEGAPAAYILCPLCSYIQDRYQPPDLALNVNKNPIILG
jgi:hypothetical protein